MKVKIKRWNAVATWRWDLPEDDVCGICQVHFDGTCPTCKYPGDDCSILSGKCGHNFHMHCILEWIKQDSAKGQCPMCRQTDKISSFPAAQGCQPTVWHFVRHPLHPGLWSTAFPLWWLLLDSVVALPGPASMDHVADPSIPQQQRQLHFDAAATAKQFL
ncbi:hypothetical protein VTK73DRAFT_1186 [Phialemonium thermophilum]|uniref:Anaphase-promoting complex subunit 11 n=1 Tax=Phialemonium thermophilum TaxID=223376 RepID=A0ABR3VTT7_9PEZI